MHAMQEGTDREGGVSPLAFVLLVAPFYANDLSNIYVKDWRWWLFIDYTGVKLVPFLITSWLIRTRKVRASQLGLTAQPIPSFLLVFVIVAFVGTVIDENGYRVLANLPGYPRLGGMPEIADAVWNWVDLIFGLLTVGVFEELVFRGFMHALLSRYTRDPLRVLVISSFAFGLIHWSNGLHAIIITSVIGAVFMMAYVRTRSLPAIMLAHFAIDFIAFADVVPKSLFRSA